MSTEYNPEDFVKAGTLQLMFERYAKLSGNPSAARPHFNADTGRYDNLGEWMALMADGRVYGSKSPLYAYSPVTSAIKLEANAGLVLEPSTNSKAGRNDYQRLLFAQCPRVNGGYDKDGTPYVTAIEGYDDRFNARTANTWALTPVLYFKRARDSSYEYKYLTDAPRAGYAACPGAYTPAGSLRPFILRACYMDSDGTLDSRSGTVPAAYYSAAVANRVAHCMANNFAWSRGRSDGLTYLSYADLWYRDWLMEIMLGVKAPRDAAVGCVAYNANYAVAAAETGVMRVVLTDAQAAYIEVGSRISVGDGTQTDRYYAPMHAFAKSALVLSKVALGNGTTAVNLDLPAAIDVPATAHVVTMAWGNGSCDGVLGTFGAPTAAGLTNGKMPFKFQNQEWQLGIYETLCDMHSVATVDAAGVATHTWYVAPDVSAPSGINTGAGWEALATQTSGKTGLWHYIKDYATEKGARVPEYVGGTSTTGYRTAWYPSAAAGDRETLVGGSLYDGAVAGCGCVRSNNALSSAGWSVGGRSSGLGHSAPAE